MNQAPTDRLAELELALEAVHNAYPDADLVMIGAFPGGQATCRAYGKNAARLDQFAGDGIEMVRKVIAATEQDEAYGAH